MQTAMDIAGLVEELRAAVEAHCERPAILIGHSWGAWLVLIAAAEHPEIARKLILVGSGPFEQRYADGIMDTRLSRLRGAEAAEARTLLLMLDGGATEDGGAVVARVGELLGKADVYCPALSQETFETAFDADMHASVWAEAAELRKSGGLLALARRVECPVAAIHGDYDPHPWRGVREPLETALRDFRMVLLERCGHEPWNERYAREAFFRALRMEAGLGAP
jgi:pimeloyl-ACP methyl ester carboxylesterase